MSQSNFELLRAQAVLALTPPWTTPVISHLTSLSLQSPGVVVGLPLGEYPVHRFCQMPGYGADGFLVPFAPGHPLIEATDVALGVVPAQATDGVGCFDKGPFEVVIVLAMPVR